jgi:hypothetical protein
MQARWELGIRRGNANADNVGWLQHNHQQMRKHLALL